MSHVPASGRVAPSDHDADQPPDGSLRSYLTGFALAAILTVIPFWLVMGHVLENHWLTTFIVLGLAVVQIAVHVFYFLHLNTRSEGGWNMMAFLLTVILVVILLIASIWVMYNENANMMPMSPIYHTQHG